MMLITLHPPPIQCAKKSANSSCVHSPQKVRIEDSIVVQKQVKSDTGYIHFQLPSNRTELLWWFITCKRQIQLLSKAYLVNPTAHPFRRKKMKRKTNTMIFLFPIPIPARFRWICREAALTTYTERNSDMGFRNG